MIHYAGIGSRKTPIKELQIMELLGEHLSNKAHLRSGGALGADQAFALKAKNKTIFYAKDCKEWCLDTVIKYLPEGITKEKFQTWKPYIQQLLGRNMMQILGENGDSPVDFVICYCDLDYKSFKSGGTGYAVRCAIDHNIKVFNIKDKNQLKALLEYIRNIPIINK